MYAHSLKNLQAFFKVVDMSLDSTLKLFLVIANYTSQDLIC